MQEREILVATTNTQQKVKIMTDAETLGELKQALDNNGVNYMGMSFTEGITKTTLLDDNSPLPRDVNFKGQVTNNLIFILTNTTKNIASGCEKTRKEAYEIIKEEGLAEDIKETYGANYTILSTETLWNYIDELDAQENNDEEEENDDTTESSVSYCVTQGILDMVDSYVEDGLLDYVAINWIIKDLQDVQETLKPAKNDTYHVGNTTITDSEIDAIANSIK